MNIAEQNLKLILRSQEPPPVALIKQAESYNFQSTTAIPLKPNQEPARVHICCVLAVEKLIEKLGLPMPDTRKPPIPPSQYTKLLNQFRSVLVAPATPKKTALPRPQTPQKTPEGKPAISPTRTPRRSARKIAILNDIDPDFDNYDDDDDEDFGANKLVFDGDDDDDLKFTTPRKRAPVGPRAGSPSPRKSPRKSPKKVSGPSDPVIDAIGVKMGLERRTIDAVLHGYNQYSQLVKDQWGLVYGLFVVVSDRAEPKVGPEHERRLVRAMGQLVPDVYVDRHEWIHWTEKIVTGQTWIMDISQKPEPQPKLVGAPGGWGLGVEYKLVNE